MTRNKSTFTYYATPRLGFGFTIPKKDQRIIHLIINKPFSCGLTGVMGISIPAKSNEEALMIISRINNHPNVSKPYDIRLSYTTK